MQTLNWDTATELNFCFKLLQRLGRYELSSTGVSRPEEREENGDEGEEEEEEEGKVQRPGKVGDK